MMAFAFRVISCSAQYRNRRTFPDGQARIPSSCRHDPYPLNSSRSPEEGIGHCRVADDARGVTIAHRLELSIPPGNRQPHFSLDVRSLVGVIVTRTRQNARGALNGAAPAGTISVLVILAAGIASLARCWHVGAAKDANVC